MTGKRAFVTGASQGLGAYVAAGLAAQGWAVTGLGRRPKDQVLAAHDFAYIQADLSRPETLERLILQIGQTPDLIVHNAVAYPDLSPATPDLSDLENVFRVNALVPYRLTHDLLAGKPEEQFCTCIMLNSEAMFHADARVGPYAASKAALRVLTAALADACRYRNASVATLLLGPLADAKKIADIQAIASKRGSTEPEITRLFLRKSNPDLVIGEFIDYEACLKSIQYIIGLGRIANGMVCRLDGGSAGSLI